MRDCRVEGLEQASDSDNDEEKDENVAVRNSALTIEITPSHASPIYLHLPTKQDKVRLIRAICSLTRAFVKSGERHIRL